MKTSTLRNETISEIEMEVTLINYAIQAFNELKTKNNINQAFYFFLGYFHKNENIEVVVDNAISYRLDDYCFDIVTKHTETTVYWNGITLRLDSIEVYEDGESCGIWTLKQILDDEVVFNTI